MNRQDLLKSMRESIGTQSPEVYFSKLTDLFSLLFDRIDSLEEDLERVKLNSTMAIHWDERVAMKMVDDEIVHMEKTGKDPMLGGNIYAQEITWLKGIYLNRVPLQNYENFCRYWQDVLGYHPFLEARQ